MYRRQPPRRYACTRCVQLKVKCIPSDTGKCQRCSRLGHPTCVFPKDVRGNNASKSPPTQTPSTPTQAHENEYIFHEQITPQLAAELLAKYRTRKMPQYPFVIIPETTDVATLHQESPFLLLCILAASLEHNPSLQDEVELIVRKEIASRLIVSVERNMDLLQGLLVHIAWHHYHWRTYHTHMYMLLPMAVMVIVDLGLDKEESFRMLPIPAEDKDLEPTSGGGQVQSAAGQRALLGCYYQCSKSSIFRRQLYMRHTKWIEHCAETLARNAEYPTDTQLRVYLGVRCLTRQSDLLLDDERPPKDCAKSWKRIFDGIAQRHLEAETLLSSLTSENDWSLRLEIIATPALVLGHALRRRSDVFGLRAANQLGVLTKSAHTIVDLFISIPPAVCMSLPASAYGTIWYCLLMLAKLSLLFPAGEGREFGIDDATIRAAALGVNAKLQVLSVGDDVWCNAVSVQEKMLAWLERAGADAPALFHSPRKQAGASAGIPCASDKVPCLPSVQWMKELNGDAHRAKQPQQAQEQHVANVSSAQVTSTDAQFVLPDDMEFGLWEQMLDNFTWFGPGMENDMSFMDFGTAL
ncbi:hypothetical protein HK57_00667 [Aspergillus ustus]|uniref:Zn(2)-C6 fungal-type domain-containing protein n=1 Tax=Aspergillus ustus TaxID=40382 RepID=A0A0C1EFX8_ASPUT|nr:hypothetical protein HK57_00667 [Aspergillus ustus]